MTKTAKNPWLKRLPILLIAAVAVIGAFTLRDYISFDALARNREALVAFRDGNLLLASVGFIAVYIVIVGFSLPGATIATLTGGFLFGLFPGVFYNVVGATIGAIMVFLAARSGFGQGVAARISANGGAAARLQQGLHENEWSVLLMMRLVPAVPFFLANLIPAFVGTSLFRFALTTFFGILPGTLVFTSGADGRARGSDRRRGNGRRLPECGLRSVKGADRGGQGGAGDAHGCDVRHRPG
jgi:uncharacterized membrane protein YdjX (TVP38/TMEM64 family)